MVFDHDLFSMELCCRGQLWILYALHWYWFGLMVKGLYKFLLKGQLEDSAQDRVEKSDKKE
jgi:hypothetical protein